jgi:pantoate--beta-alanine ligase
MAAQLQLDIDIIACPIVREEDGLALSSRNTRLTAEQRRNAPRIAETLFASVEYAKTHTVAETISHVVDTINTVPEMKVEYYEIVDGTSLLPVKEWSDSNFIVGCITVYNGEVRLIDNIAYSRP